MKTCAILAFLAGSVAAFTPSPNVASRSTALPAVFDDMVGAVDYRGKEFKFDPVSVEDILRSLKLWDIIVSFLNMHHFLLLNSSSFLKHTNHL